jgi:hypothetical protein
MAPYSHETGKIQPKYRIPIRTHHFYKFANRIPMQINRNGTELAIYPLPTFRYLNGVTE